jgi:hypothetical protein
LATPPTNAPTLQKVGTIVRFVTIGPVKAGKAFPELPINRFSMKALRSTLGKADSKIKIEVRKLCHLAEPPLAAVRRDPSATGSRRRKSSILNAIAARMLTSFHLRTTYGLLQPNLAAGSKRLRAGASAKTAFAPHPEETKHQKRELD